ncbi:MAG TPA: hypothetical protein VGK73_20575 [Polyangiaceae bacterium]
MVTRWNAWSVLGACLGSALACNQILGIDQAAYDSRLEANPASAATGGTAGSGGSDAQSGSGGTNSASGSAGTAHQHTNNNDSHAGEGGGGGEPPPPGTGGSSVNSSGGNAGKGHGNGNEAGEDSGASGAAGGGGEEPPKELCERYCDEMESQCQGDAKQYVDRSQCLRVCRLFPEGVVTEDINQIPDENTAACRLKYAEKARYGLGAEVADYCFKAGPSGDGTCGTICQGFCSLMGKVCTPEEAGESHFASDEECLSVCEGLPPAGFSYSSSNPLVADGNHALCRLWHVTSAAMVDPLEHCEHSLGITLCEAPLQ